MEKCHNFFHITFYDGTRVGAQRADRSRGYKWLEEVGGPRDGTGLYNKLTAGKSNDLDLFPFKIGDDNCYNLNSTKNDPKYISYCKSFVRKSLFGWRPKLFSHFLIQKPALDDNAGTWRFNNYGAQTHITLYITHYTLHINHYTLYIIHYITLSL